MRKARLPDGTILQFPDETPDDVMDRIVKQHLGVTPEPSAPASAQSPSLGTATSIGQYRPAEAALGFLKNVGRETVKNAPELGGMMAGGAAGLAMGGPPGAVVGAGAGALGGTSVKQALQRLYPGMFGQGPATTGEALKEQAVSAATGGLGEAGGQAVPQLLSRYIGPRLKPYIMRIMQTLEREKIPYTAGDIREGGGWQIIENLMRGTLLGGTRMMRHTTNAGKQLWNYKERMLNQIGPLTEKNELGRVLAEATEKRHGDLMGPGGVFERLYSKFDVLKKAPIDTQYIRAEAQKILNEVREVVRPGVMPSANSPESPSRFINTLADLASIGKAKDPLSGKIIDVPVTYKQIWGVKKVIDGMLRASPDDPLRTEAKGTLKRLHNILDEAMERSAKQADPALASQIRAVNASYGEAKALYETESLVKDINRMDPEKITQRYFSKDSVTPADDLLSALSLQDKRRLLPAIQRRKLQDLFENATRTREDLEVTSGAILRTQFKKNEPMLAKLFKDDPQKWEALQEFLRASEVSQASGAMINPASGRQLLAYSQMGSAAQWTWAGVGVGLQALGGIQISRGEDMGEKFMRTGSYVIGPWVLARMLTNPTMARTLARGFSMSAKTAARTGWTSRVAAMAEMVKKNNQAPAQEQEP